MRNKCLKENTSKAAQEHINNKIKIYHTNTTHPPTHMVWILLLGTYLPVVASVPNEGGWAISSVVYLD